MKTIATKLDNKDYERFLELCNESGNSKSEELRRIIRDFIEGNEEPDESLEGPKQKPEPKAVLELITEPKPSLEVEF